jgi:hypothetical protein
MTIKDPSIRRELNALVKIVGILEPLSRGDRIRAIEHVCGNLGLDAGFLVGPTVVKLEPGQRSTTIIVQR